MPAYPDAVTAHTDDHAWRLHRRILELAEADEPRLLLAIADDPATEALLARLPEAARHRARLHLRRARRWSDRQAATNRRRLVEARAALDALDLELARGLLARIDDAFLEPADRRERDQMLLELSARTMEFEDIARRVQPEQRRARRWRRRRDR